MYKNRTEERISMHTTCFRTNVTKKDTVRYVSINNKQIHSEMNSNTINRIFSRIILATVLLFAGVFSVQAQEPSVVSGIIVSPENKPVPNVSVSVEGSSEMPDFTNEEGKFSVNLPGPNQWIIIAPAQDFKRKRVFVGENTDLKVMVSPNDVATGEDEVVLLNQNIEKRNLTSSFSNLDLNNLNHSITPSIDRYMQGRIPGMHVIKQSGAPASGAVTYLRGLRSLNAINNPLYVVDGMITEPQGLFNSIVSGYSYNSLLALNPLDISNATVMKDPVYAAAYGSKASNGLIMIQTLDPSATETSFDIDFRRGLSLQPSRFIPQLNAQQHKTLANEVLLSSGVAEEVLYEQYENLFIEPVSDRYINYQHNTDWQKLIFENASFTNFNLKVKGGDEIARYGLSLGYYDNNGIIKNTNYNSFNLRFVSLVNIFTWLRMNASVAFLTSNSDLKESARSSETSPMYTALAKSPLLHPYQYDADGLPTLILSEVDEFGVSNPLATIDNFIATNKNYQVITSLGFEMDLAENLFLKTNVGITYNTLKEQLFMPNSGMELYYNGEVHNVSKASTNTFTGFSNNTLLVYDKEIDADHKFNSTTGFNVMTNKFQYDWGIAKNSHINDQYRMLADGVDNLRELGGETRNWNWVSLYEKVTYSFRDRYIADATVSFDGSSRVGQNAPNALRLFNNPIGLFYSGGLAWRLSSEPFMADLAFVEELKFRASIGRTGNDDIGESNALNYYKTVHYRSTTGIVPAVIQNDELNYEIVDQLNAGIDLGLFGNRVRLNFDVFKNTTSDMLLYKPLETYFGFDYRPENSGSMENTGWDAYAFFRLVNTRNFKWDIEATVSSVNNKVTAISNDKFVIDMDSYQLVNELGSPANSFYGYVYQGVYSTQEQAAEAGLVNQKGIAYKAGDAIYQDISGPDGEADGRINDFDKIAIGSPMPELIGGISTSFTVQRWKLSAFVNAAVGVDVFNYVRYQNESMTGVENQSVKVLSRWQYQGQETDVPRALWNDPVGNSDFSTRWIEDASFVRLNNLSLSYTIPNEFLVFKHAEFYISASNLLTLTKYLGYDPEFAYSYNALDRGVDYGLTPTPRQFLVGIKIGL